MKTSRLFAAHLLLMFPALLFMLSLVLREIHASFAVRLVGWYAARMWTLWVLLIALPLLVLSSGSFALFRFGEPRKAAPTIATTTVSAALVLAIVALHMAAN